MELPQNPVPHFFPCPAPSTPRPLPSLTSPSPLQVARERMSRRARARGRSSWPELGASATEAVPVRSPPPGSFHGRGEARRSRPTLGVRTWCSPLPTPSPPVPCQGHRPPSPSSSPQAPSAPPGRHPRSPWRRRRRPGWPCPPATARVIGVRLGRRRRHPRPWPHTTPRPSRLP